MSDLSTASNAYGAALSTIEQVVFDAKPDQRFDATRAWLKIKRPPWFDFGTEAFSEGVRSRE